MKHFSKYLDSTIHEGTRIQASDTKRKNKHKNVP
jgi:hypothetical protein